MEFVLTKCVGMCVKQLNLFIQMWYFVSNKSNLRTFLIPEIPRQLREGDSANAS